MVRLDHLRWRDGGLAWNVWIASFWSGLLELLEGLFSMLDPDLEKRK